VRACYLGLLIMGTVPRFVLRASEVVVALTVLLVCAIFATDARASVSIAVTWDGLLKESTAAALITSMEARPVWENGRIYTYTHVRVDRAVAGELASGGDAWIRTMGGIVGKVGQIVEGEASFAPGERSLLFVHPGPVGALVVTARGQGQFPVVADDPKQPAHIVRSQGTGMLLAPRIAAPRLASDVLHGRPVEDVVGDIASAWGATHVRP
jgi:hypothetical protein